MRNLDWRYFNVISIGMNGDVEELQAAIKDMEDLLATAKAFVKAHGDWSSDVDIAS